MVRCHALCHTLLLPALLCTGCGPRAEQQPEDAPAGPPLTEETLPETAPGSGVPAAPSGSLAPRPGRLEDTLLIEGMPEPRTMLLTTSPARSILPFSTYVPGDMRVQFDGAGDTPAAR